jgi:hypothetical protein
MIWVGRSPKSLTLPLKSYRLSGPIYPHYNVKGTYSFIKNNDKTIDCKWNILSKCQGCRIVGPYSYDKVITIDNDGSWVYVHVMWLNFKPRYLSR